MAVTVRIGGCCCPGGVDMCQGLCCADEIPCDLCIEFTSFIIDSDNPDCGLITLALPPPWITSSVDTSGASDGYTSRIIDTPATAQASLIISTRLECNGSPPSDATWQVGIDLVTTPPCIDIDVTADLDEIADVGCDLGELLGTHNVELNGLDLSGFAYSITATYVVTAGPACGISVGCCDKPQSRILAADFTLGIGDAKTQIEWNGTAWAVTVSRSNALPGHTGAITGTVTCTAGVWHGTFSDDGGVFFNADLTVVSCSPTVLTGTDGLVSCTVHHQLT